MVDSVLFWCGPQPPPKSVSTRDRKIITLDSFPANGNVNLKLSQLSLRLARNIPSILLDLLEVATYVYCADQAVSKGGKAGRQDGKDWYRRLEFDIQVRNVELWNSKSLTKALSELLGFLSDDAFHFKFRKLKHELPLETYMEFEKDQPWFDADSVLMFSGGLDSLVGAIDEVVNQQRSVILASHRPVAIISRRQTDLVQALSASSNRGQLLHVPVWANKDGGLTRDSNQRLRSFLYASIGAALAKWHKLNLIKFYENGVTSIHLPFSEQLVGTRASRTTHPRTIRLMSEFFSALFESDFRVENPFIWKTKADIVRLIKNGGFDRLINLSNSCTRTRIADKQNSHCGVCSQCIDRRLAVEHEGLGEADPESQYRTRLFVDELPKGEARTAVESVIRSALDLEDMDELEFTRRYPESVRVLREFELPSSETALRVLELYRRYGSQVSKTVGDHFARQVHVIAKKEVLPGSILDILIDQGRAMVGEGSDAEFIHGPDYRYVVMRNEIYRLRPGEASIVRALHKAYQKGTPEVGLTYLIEVTSGEFNSAKRLRDVFKNKAARDALVRGCKGHNLYRLNVAD